jgi:uncharacterized protein (DUF2236 family)
VLGWGRAILLQIAHPLVARGVADHTAFQRTPWGRLRRFHGTLAAMLGSTFGTADEVHDIARRVTGIHDRVHGQLRGHAGPFGPETRYSAHDPALLRWVHATLVQSHLLVYDLYVGPLAPDDRDRYCHEASGMEHLLRMPPGTLPRTAAQLERYVAGMLVGGEVVVTDVARRLARDVIWPPGSWAAAPLVWLLRLPTIGLLPPAIRAAYGFRWTGTHERALRLSVRLLRATLPMTPSVVRHWPRARAAFRDAAGGAKLEPAAR